MTQINVKGPIINDGDKWFYNMFKMPATSPDDINNALPEDGTDVDIVINSGGGLIDAGSEIYTALRSYSGKINVSIVGMAASAASVIAMAGDHVTMSPTAQMMIHNVQSSVYGDSQIHQKESEVLDTFNKSIAAPYVAKTGKSQEEILNVMKETTWLNAEKAKEQGFVDEIMFEDSNPELELTASFESGLVSHEAIEQARTALLDESNKQTSEATSMAAITDDDIKRIANIVQSNLTNAVKPKTKQAVKFNPFAF